MPPVPVEASASARSAIVGDAVAIDVLHREDVDARRANLLLLLLVEIADADEHGVLRARPTAIEPIDASSSGSWPSSAASGIPCTLPLSVVAACSCRRARRPRSVRAACEVVRRTQSALAATEPAARL